MWFVFQLCLNKSQPLKNLSFVVLAECYIVGYNARVRNH
jgi:hypothetical protein